MTRLRNLLSADHPMVADHRLSGTPVLPGAAQIDAILTACDATRPGRRWELTEVSFLAPLLVAGTAVHIETALGDNGSWAVSAADPAGGGEPAAWTVHCQARAESAPLPPPEYLDLAAWWAACSDELRLAEITTWRQSSGIAYGPTYQTIRSARRGPDRICAVLRADDDVMAPHHLPPPLLDAVFQCLGILDAGENGSCLPWHVRRVRVRRRISGTVIAMIERTGAGGGTVRGRATVVNQQGEILLELDRIALRARAPARRRPRPGSIQVQTWRPVVPTPLPAPADGVALVVSSRAGEVTVDEPVIRLDPAELNSARLEVALAGVRVRELVYLAPAVVHDPQELLTGALSLVRHLAGAPPMPAVTIVTAAGQSVRGGEDVEPGHAALWGLARALRAEYPRSDVRLVDTAVMPPGGLHFAESELAWRDEGWLAPESASVPGPPASGEIEGGRFLITGGMGSVGMQVAEFLAGQGCSHLTLVGRTVPREDPRRARLDRLSALCDVNLVSTDVRSLPEALRDTKPFDGVLHAAGVLRDGLARSLRPQDIADVFAPKVAGVHALDEALRNLATPPRFVALFSSVAAVHGNVGQIVYGTANAYLDGFAARRRAQGEPWYSLNWGLWTVGMGEAVVARAAAHGVGALSGDEGTALFHTAIGLPPGNYVLSQPPAPKGEPMTVATQTTELWLLLSTVLTRTLHVPRISADDDLIELGLDSMMAVEVAAALAAEGLDVEPAALFEHNEVEALLTHLASLPVTPTPPDRPAPAAVPVPLTAPVSVATAVAVPAPAPQPQPAPPPLALPERLLVPVPASRASAPDFVPDWNRFRGTDTPPAVRRPAPVSPAPPVERGPRLPGPSWPPSAPAQLTGLPDAGLPSANLPRTGTSPRRTLPSRLSADASGSFLESRIDALSVDDRAIVARDDYFYEPVVERASGSWIRFDDRWFLNFASYSYLGLVGHEYINEQAIRAVETHGTGAHGVRLLAGTLRLHRELELALARFLGTEDAIVYTSGYMTNMATIGALVGPGDVIIGDVYNHASILDGYRLSGAAVLTYAHNDLADLERALRKAGDAGKLVVSDAVFSMDGDIADLPGILSLCERYDAALMVDEAHSLGVLGATGRGIAEHFRVDPARIALKMGTLSKTIPSAGGYVAGSADLIFALKNNARGWMFSAAGTPMQVAAAKAAIEVIEASPELPGLLRARTDRYRLSLQEAGFDTLASVTPVVPIICSSAEQAQAMARLCQRDGLFVQPIVYPTVPKALPRLRTIVNLTHSDDDLKKALEILADAGRQVGLLH
ncbi:aminotransferase class I/II-fold pyridoxal phosphate-dependent enzyme [Parafrankia sp. FMc2]|uniref:aminotransferase class I/II-fold pyridoxal phosphate-dependent enzyme n=1 Tax=Parafrankia sp. FMc2 TaxID=3233196 RepID=UPI0034D3C59D